MAFIFFSGQCVSNVVLRVLCCTALQEECQNFMDRFVEKNKSSMFIKKGDSELNLIMISLSRPPFSIISLPQQGGTQDWEEIPESSTNEVLNLKCRKIATWKMHHFKNLFSFFNGSETRGELRIGYFRSSPCYINQWKLNPSF